MKPTLSGLSSVALALAMAACGGSDATGPGDGSSFLKATIDGSSWNSGTGAESFGVPITLPGLYTITGVDAGSGFTMALSLYNIGGPGTFPMGVGPTVAGGSAVVSNASGGWATPLSGEAGTLTIATLTDSRIAGTFSFSATALTGAATGTRAVTNGSFDLEVRPTGTVGALPDYAGSKVTAALGGASFTAAAVAGQLGTGSPNILAVSGSNVTRLVSITLTGVTGPGTYTLGPGSSAGTLGVSGVEAPLVAWSSSAAGSSATVTVSSITATRILGTFSGTLGAAAGTSATGTLSVANGVFDLGRPGGG